MPDHHYTEQVPRFSRRMTLGMLVLFSLLLPLCGCGKRANQLDPPPGTQDTGFPRTYPDPSTDPKP